MEASWAILIAKEILEDVVKVEAGSVLEATPSSKERVVVERAAAVLPSLLCLGAFCTKPVVVAPLARVRQGIIGCKWCMIMRVFKTRRKNSKSLHKQIYIKRIPTVIKTLCTL